MTTGPEYGHPVPPGQGPQYQQNPQYPQNPQNGPGQQYPQNAPGQQYPQNPQYQGQQPYPPGPQYGAPAAPPKKRTGLRIFGALVVIGIIVVVIFGYLASKKSPDAAKIGDCVSRSGGNDIKIVKCTDAKAAYKVVGKVTGQSQVAFNINSGRICKPYPGTTSAFWKGKVGKSGYVLCLGRVK
jgi:hypothetical protein